MLRQLRRFASALAGVLVLQLVLGAAGACGMAAANGPVAHAHGQAAPAGGHTAGGHAHHAATAAGPAVADDSGARPPAPHHGAPTHCATAAGCAFDVSLVVSTAVADKSSPAPSRIAAPDDRAPASVVGTPEPPPPRA